MNVTIRTQDGREIVMARDDPQPHDRLTLQASLDELAQEDNIIGQEDHS